VKHNSKAGISRPYFLLFFFFCFDAQAESTKSHTFDLIDWKGLIYYDDGFLISSKDFLLSHDLDKATPESEVSSFVKLSEIDNNLICKFPARYSYLYKTKKISEPPNFSHCPELTAYLSKVPVDDFYYIFAAENITSVTSMMGHGFLMASGVDDGGTERQHTYSFFAELNSLNPVTLFYGAIVSGLDGKFALHPYQKDLEQYLVKENREIWSYKLKLDPQEKELLKLALWELRYVNLTYLFHNFNCATLLLHTISIVKPALLKHKRLFVSPLDIAKAIEDESITTEVSVTLPDKTIAALATFREINEQYIDLELYSASKKPTLNPQDSLVSLYGSRGGLNISFLPTSHLLRTPSSYRGASTELKIGYVDFNLSSSKVNELALYSFNDYKSYNSESLSSEIYLGYRPSHLRNTYNNRKSLEVEYLAGKTWQYFGLQATALIGGGYNEDLSLDSKLSLSWVMPNLISIHTSAHYKRIMGEQSSTYSTIQVSKMLNDSVNAFIEYESILEKVGHRFKVGFDYHF
jgi:hypothetical protein